MKHVQACNSKFSLDYLFGIPFRQKFQLYSGGGGGGGIWLFPSTKNYGNLLGRYLKS